ncbi:hypothetical protein D1007_25799 [Hordeum vulgare]|nr:hypothetical protein D1007_25799 [Hordeum vulgare]
MGLSAVTVPFFFLCIFEGLLPPFLDFFSADLEHCKINALHLHLNSVFLVATFAYLYEEFLEVMPLLDLFCTFYNMWCKEGLIAGCASFLMVDRVPGQFINISRSRSALARREAFGSTRAALDALKDDLQAEESRLAAEHLSLTVGWCHLEMGVKMGHRHDDVAKEKRSNHDAKELSKSVVREPEELKVHEHASVAREQEYSAHEKELANRDEAILRREADMDIQEREAARTTSDQEVERERLTTLRDRVCSGTARANYKSGYLDFFIKVVEVLESGVSKVDEAIQGGTRDLLDSAETCVFSNPCHRDHTFDFTRVMEPVLIELHGQLRDEVH